MAEEWYRQGLSVAYRRRGSIVVFDRHFVADYHAADVAAPARTTSRRVHGFLLSRLYPKPDLVIFLDAPPPTDTLAAVKGRKDEEIGLGAREIYVHYGEGMAQSKLVVPAAKAGTARNMNTIATLANISTPRTKSGGGASNTSPARKTC